MAGNLPLVALGSSAVGLAVGFCISRYHQKCKDDIIADVAIKVLKEVRSTTSSVNNVVNTLAKDGGKVLSIIPISIGFLVCGVYLVYVILNEVMAGDDDID